MAEKQTVEVHTQERQRHPAQSVEATDHEAAPAPFFEGMAASPGTLLDTLKLHGRGASPLRMAALQHMQQTVGNRATQRFIQRAARTPSPPVGEDLAQRIQIASGRGHSLDTAVQRQLEQGLGADLSDVRVHTDGEADALARAVDAVAFTSGRDIFFRQGAYNPASPEGRWLLAHEATHVVQQATGPVAGTPAPEGVMISHPSDSFEEAANRMADAIVSGHAASPASMTGVSPAASIQRQAEGREAVPLQTPSDLSAVPVQRQTGVEIAGLVLGGISIVQAAIQGSQGGLSYTSDQITYPRELERVGNARSKSETAAYFFSAGMFTDNETRFKVHGDFSDSYERANRSNRVMANVYIDLDETTSYSQSLLTFNARALQTPYGTPEDPKVRFVCSGRFDPAGPGDCSYRVVLEVDQHCKVNTVESQITNGEGNLQGYEYTGFTLFI